MTSAEIAQVLRDSKPSGDNRSQAARHFELGGWRTAVEIFALVLSDYEPDYDMAAFLQQCGYEEEANA